MKFIRTDSLNEASKRAAHELWNKEYPKSLNHSSLSEFEHYLDQLEGQSHILLLNEQQEIKAWYFDFIRENERWFAMILDSEIHGRGLGTKLLNQAKEKNEELNGWVIDHNKALKANESSYLSPIEFYKKNDFEVLNEIRLESEKISAVKIRWAKL